MNKSIKLTLVPVMLCFFAMGFVDLVGKLFLMMLPSFGFVEADGHSVGKINHKTFTVGFV